LVDVGASTQVSVTILIPPSSAGRARLCPANTYGPASLTLHGTVRDSASGAPARNARVTARWVGSGLRTDAQLSVTFQERATVTDSTGKYVFCGLPSDRRLMMSADEGAAYTTAKLLALEPVSQNIRMYDMRIWGGKRASAESGAGGSKH
jgi:hypothetical protein